MATVTNCEDVSAQMMELLYGELPADARANVDAHVAGCARCRSELEGFEKTRAAARAGLDEAPPARAHAAIMKAAAAHLAAQAQPVAPKPAVPERVSFWDRLRVKWALPTFATVGAVAVFLIASRLFLNPEHALDSHRAVQNEEAPVPAAAPATREAPKPVAEPAEPAPPAPSPQGGASSAAASAPRHHAAAAPPPSSRRDLSDDPLAGLGLDSPAPAEASRAPRGHGKAKKPALAELKNEGGEGRFAPAPPPKAWQDRAKDVPLGNNGFAAPPAPREEAAPRYKEAEKPAVAKKAPQRTVDDLLPSSSPAAKRVAPASTPAKGRAALDDDSLGRAQDKAPVSVGSSGNVGGSAGPRNKGDGYGGGGLAQVAPTTPPPRPTTAATGERSAMKQFAQPPAAAAAPAPSPPPPPPAMQAPTQSKPKAARRSAVDVESDEVAAQEPEAKAKNEKKPAVAGKPSAIEVLVQRADRLFAEGRWSEAAAAYRELVRKDPHNDEVKRWRERVVAADNFDLSERQETLAKRKAAAPRTAADNLESDQQQRSDTKAARARSKDAKSSGKASISDDAAK